MDLLYNCLYPVSYTHLELPSTLEGIAKKLLLLYIGPYVITKDNGNNTYEISNITTKKIKGVYNQASIKKFYEEK